MRVATLTRVPSVIIPVKTEFSGQRSFRALPWTGVVGHWPVAADVKAPLRFVTLRGFPQGCTDFIPTSSEPAFLSTGKLWQFKAALPPTVNEVSLRSACVVVNLVSAFPSYSRLILPIAMDICFDCDAAT